MFRIIEKGGDIDAPLIEFAAFSKAVKWLVSCAAMVGTDFEVWWVRRYKRQDDEVWLECAYEVLP